MTREEKLQKAHQMFDNRNLLIELKWQREYFKRGYVSNREELFNLWIFDECIKALEQEPILDKIREQIKSNLRGVEITLEVLVENDPLRPKMEGAKDTLEECLELIDKAESEEVNE